MSMSARDPSKMVHEPLEWRPPVWKLLSYSCARNAKVISGNTKQQGMRHNILRSLTQCNRMRVTHHCTALRTHVTSYMSRSHLRTHVTFYVSRGRLRTHVTSHLPRGQLRTHVTRPYAYACHVALATKPLAYACHVALATKPPAYACHVALAMKPLAYACHVAFATKSLAYACHEATNLRHISRTHGHAVHGVYVSLAEYCLKRYKRNRANLYDASPASSSFGIARWHRCVGSGWSFSGR